MTKEIVIHLVKTRHAKTINSLYNCNIDECRIHSEYEGSQNLIYYVSKKTKDYVLRISYRTDRSLEQITAEIDFINFLAENKVSVSKPVKSAQNNYIEILSSNEIDLYVTMFTRAPGMLLVENGYQYRENVPVTEYYQNWGRLLGKMHRLSSTYDPGPNRRFVLFDDVKNRLIPDFLPGKLSTIKDKFDNLCTRIDRLPKTRDTYGLLHADFCDGNICIDYDNGDLTVFDFDDSAYSWYMYDIADSWSKGFGWAQFEENPESRKNAMDFWFDNVIEGYLTEFTIDSEMFKHLELFVKAIEMNNFLGELEFQIKTDGQIEYDGELQYTIFCIEHELPWFGLYDSIYSHRNPFCIS